MPFLNQVEKEYFSRKLEGDNSGKTLNQIKREYYIKVLGEHSPTYPFNQLEAEWENKMIADGLATPMSFKKDRLNFFLNAS